MLRLAVHSAVLVLSVLGMALWVAPESPWYGIVGGLAAAVALILVDALLADVRRLRIAWYSLRYYGREIRISASYLYRIPVDGRYLLVKSARYPQYQPVGGVFKINPSGSRVMRTMRVLDDNYLPVDAVSEGDLRIRIKGKRLLRFVRWYELGINRETNAWREFYEELVETGILSSQQFPCVRTDFVKRIYRPLRYSKYAKSLELLIADVFELVPTASQLEELRDLARRGEPDQRVAFVSSDQIERLGSVPGSGHVMAIGEHARWTL